VRAATVTADDTWLAGVRMCLAWFLGDNDAKVPLIDERTGGAMASPAQGAAVTRAPNPRLR
jgi:hypothetical protein